MDQCVVIVFSAGPAEEVGLKMDRRQMLRAAAALFSRQAIRSQQDLQGSVPGLTGQDADIVLPRLAYMFRNGEPQPASCNPLHCSLT